MEYNRDVYNAQALLNRMGHSVGRVDGLRGDNTNGGFKGFLLVAGVISPTDTSTHTAMSPDKMNKVLGVTFINQVLSDPKPSAGDIKLMQRALSDLGIFNGEISGRMTPKTQAALEQFKEKYGHMDARQAAAHFPDVTPGPLPTAKPTAPPVAAAFSSSAAPGQSAPTQPAAPSLGAAFGGVAKPPSSSGPVIQEVPLRQLAQMDYIDPYSDKRHIQQLQMALNDLGYDVGKADKTYGNQTRSQVMKFQRDHGLEVSGVADRETLARIDSMGAEVNQRLGSLRNNIVNVASQFVGMREEGQNRGPMVETFLRSDYYRQNRNNLDAVAGRAAPAGSPYCAGFISYVLDRVCPGMSEYKVGALAFMHEAQRNGTFNRAGSSYQVKPGDVLVFQRGEPGSGQGHVAIVERVENGRIHTIEGNTTPQGDFSDGNRGEGVFRRSYTAADLEARRYVGAVNTGQTYLASGVQAPDAGRYAALPAAETRPSLAAVAPG